jgi:hypothetical protein
MKRFVVTLSLIAGTAFAAAPLAAQTSNGPWWDPGRTQTRTDGGSVYGRNGSVYSQQADGVWRADSRDRNGNTVYVRTRYDSNGSLVREWATRNILGRYNVIDRQYLSNGSNRGTYDTRGVYDSRGVYDRRAQEAQMRRDQEIRREEIRRQQEYQREQARIDRDRQTKNDRWYENNGHDNGKHNGQYKDKGHGKGHGHDD